MKVTVVQSKFKVADFAFNIKNVYEKLAKAQTLGVKIIDESELLSMMGSL